MSPAGNLSSSDGKGELSWGLNSFPACQKVRLQKHISFVAVTAGCPLGCRREGSLICMNICWEGVERMEPGFTQQNPVTGKEAMRTDWNTRNFAFAEKSPTFSPGEVVKHWTMFPKQILESLSLQTLQPNIGHGPGADCVSSRDQVIKSPKAPSPPWSIPSLCLCRTALAWHRSQQIDKMDIQHSVTVHDPLRLVTVLYCLTQSLHVSIAVKRP